MASSDFYIPTTLSTSSVLIDTSGVSEQSTLMYKSSSSKFVATERAIPVGIIRMYPSNSAPTNYIICNGQTLNTFTYRLLHAVMSNKYGGTAYSAGVTDQSGVSTTFTLPNLSNTYFPWASNANTGLANTGLTGVNAIDIDHTHTFPITQTSGTANVDHSHGGLGSLQSANHTHTYNTDLQAGGSHAHNIQGNSANHTHLMVRSNTAAAATTGNATANHSHAVGAPWSNHSHSTSNSDGHTHGTSEGGATSNHSSHNYLMTSNAATLSHAHTHNAVTGIYFYVRFQ